MKNIFVSVLFVLAACSSSSPSNSGPALPSPQVSSVAYASTSSTTVLDAYGTPGAPVVVLVLHGGAWLSGSRTEADVRQIAAAVLARGGAAVVPDYRLTQEARWPAQVEDARAALAWAKAWAPSARVFAMGLSAGGTIALELDAPAISVSGPANMTNATSTSQWAESMAGAFGHPAPFSPAEVSSISPALSCARRASTLLVHAVGDSQVSVTNSDDEDAALRADAAPVNYVRIATGPYSTTHGSCWQDASALEALWSFLGL